jgi:hypothetical protein
MDIKSILKDVITLDIASLGKRVGRSRVRTSKKIRSILRNYSRKRLVPAEIPVIINNRNRYTYFRLLIEWLEKAGIKKIYIIDNDSTYPPLLEYYKNIPYKVFFTGENLGHLALWKSNIYRKFRSSYYIYTDPDVLPSEDCKEDFLQYMISCLDKYPVAEKIGFALKTDDLPDHYRDKQHVIDWEKKFWEHEVAPDIFDAPVDTTFALYRPYTNYSKRLVHAYRIAGKYCAKHLPWYEDTDHPTEENLYYSQHIREGASHWIKKTDKRNKP